MDRHLTRLDRWPMLACVGVLLLAANAAHAANATDTRAYVCKDSLGNKVADSNCASAGPKPAPETRVGASCDVPTPPSNPAYCFVEGGAWHLTDYAGSYPGGDGAGTDGGHRYFETRIGSPTRMGVDRVQVTNSKSAKFSEFFPHTPLDGTAIQSMVIGPKASVKVYMNDNLTGEVALDIHGPAIVYDHFSQITGDSRRGFAFDPSIAIPALTQTFSGTDTATGLPLQGTWPPSTRTTPPVKPVFDARTKTFTPATRSSSMSNWYYYGSMTVTCDP